MNCEILLDFKPRLLKKTTTKQLGFDDPTVRIATFTDRPGWSNGKLLDTSIPQTIEKAIAKCTHASEYSSSAFDRVYTGPATDPNLVLVTPLTWKHATTVETVANTSSDGISFVTTHYDAILLTEDHAVDPRYLAYFVRYYPGHELWAAPGSDSTVIVKRAGKPVGCIAPMKV
jgi:hypothetical protein